MSLVLNIETATKNCSVCLAESGNIISYKESASEQYQHGELLHHYIKTCLAEAQCDFSALDAIAISKGPGSYTGLRIGVSAAKGYCFALDIPLISINTLDVLAKSHPITSGYMVPMLDARRMEVYAKVLDHQGSEMRETRAEILTEDSFAPYLQKDTVYFLGDGVSKWKTICTHPNAVYLNMQYPSAKAMCVLSYQKFQAEIFENVAYFEPYYLKEFIGLQKKR
ncbi:MAG: tRNA (adenosine(37)-N6)-threonylcarbamoyltransferase complex dimerization subunit type 1 TsaB [Flavobacteriaceae bacterium]|nr:tRNA (adenosine(37)-N6)-threonylcarbamoyltransferase complex dimerization subunit type 1 TsaB [Flavobacteriaceae bacterium]